MGYIFGTVLLVQGNFGKQSHRYSMVTLVTIHDHGAISLVVIAASGEGTVDRNLLVVRAKSVTMSVRIGEEATLHV